MKLWLILLLALPVSRCAYAAPPSCYPADGKAAETVPSVIIQSGGSCLQWHCPSADGYSWKKVSICGTWSEATQSAIDQLKSAMSLDKAAKDQLWVDTFNQPMATDSPDAALLQAANAQPLPTKIPPAGLMTQTNIAYKLNRNVNAPPTFTAVGNIKTQVVCDTSKEFAGYFRIDRSAVSLPKGAIAPLEYWAVCR